MKIAFVLAAVASLTACATTPDPVSVEQPCVMVGLACKFDSGAYYRTTYPRTSRETDQGKN